MNEITERLSANLRLAREAAGLTRNALSERLKCSPNAIYLWETGKREMNHEAICQASEALGRSWLWFYQEQDVEQVRASAKISAQEELTPQERIVLKKLLSKFAVGDDGLSTCPPASDEEKSVILAALAAKARLLEDLGRKAG